jgi:protein JSN1
MNEFIIDSMIDRLWEIAQGRFGARSMRAVLESPLVTMNQQVSTSPVILL